MPCHTRLTRGLFLFTVLLLVTINVVVDVDAIETEGQVHTVYTKSEGNIELGEVHEPKNEVTLCELMDNHGKIIILYPISENDTENKRFSTSKFWKRCKTSVYKITDKDVGVWKMRMTVNKTGEVEEKISSFNVKVRKIYQPLSPTQKINVYPNKQVSIRFKDKFENLKSCKLLSPEQIEYNVGSDKSVDIKKLGKCGAKLLIKPEYNGIWTLVADLNNNTAFTISFNIIIKDDKDLSLNQTILHLKRGEEGHVTGDKSNNARVCIIEDPYGVKVHPLQDGVCDYRIPTVTEHHQGIWKIYYGLEGYQKLVKQEVMVTTYEISNFNSSVVHTSSGDINLLCQVRGRDMKFCSFIRPDGEILHMSYAVGNDKYEYYGNGLYIQEGYGFEVKTHDCGITIHKPSAEDYGSWKCLFKFQSSREATGRILKVIPLTSSGTSVKHNVTGNDVYAKRGESYKIRCESEELLSYCWLRSPNGTAYSVTRLDQHRHPATDASYIEYEGAGLELGECGARIAWASDSDAGRWTCNMGVANGPEIQASFHVTVKDSHLMAASSEIILKSTENTDLICQPLPESKRIIEACRWINPLGQGININMKGYYYTEITSTRCKLTIRDADVSRDVGFWSCHASFVPENGVSQEWASDVLLVTSPDRRTDGNSLSFILGIGVCSGLVALLLLVQRYRCRARRHDEEIILHKSNAGYP